MSQHIQKHLKHILPTVGLVFLILLSGCKPKKYQVETRIEPDGKFHRKLQVPIDESLPPEALVKPKSYPPSTQPADYKLQPAWLKQWKDQQTTSAPAEAKEGNYLKVTGQFASAEKIPRHYHLIAYPLEDRCSTNRIKHRYIDYSLFGIDDWTETITETVSLPEYVATLDELISKMTPTFEAALDEVFEREYDLRDFHPYLRKQLASTFRKYALWSYQHRPDSGVQLSPNNLQQLKQILADTGFDLPLNEAGDAIDHDRVEETFKAFCLNLLQTRIRSRSTGNYLTTKQAKTLMRRLDIDFDEEADKGNERKHISQVDNAIPSSAPANLPASAPAEEPLKDKLEHWDQILSRYYEKLHHAPLEEVSFIWSAKMGGAHRQSCEGFLFPHHESSDEREFNYELRTPGPILETNGERLGEQAAAWHFYPGHIWPHGYVMHATAVRWNREAEKKLFGRIVLNNLDTVLGLRKSIDAQESVRDALHMSVEVGNFIALETIVAHGNAEERDAAQVILMLKDSQ